MDTEKNIYGLSEGVFKACQFLGLKFPTTVPKELDPSKEHVPSDYFGDDFEFDAATKKRLCAELKWTAEQFSKRYKSFSARFSSQKPLKQTKTDLNVYFCDHFLFDKGTGFLGEDYFHFEFYKKSLALRSTFMWINYETLRRIICNDRDTIGLLNNKSRTNTLFSEFFRRDWIYIRNCTFDDFKVFVEKHPRFFSKPVAATQGKGAEIITVAPTDDLEKLFADLKSKRRILEELISQHEDIAAFCPDTVNTIRVCTFLDIHNVVHILTTSGRFGRMGKIVDNFHGGGFSVVIDPKTGVIISDGINGVHERVQKHSDTGKTFKGFKYPSWEKVRAVVKKMAKMIPQLRHIGWDIAINSDGEPVLVEANGSPGVRVQQAPDSVGRLYIYQPLIDELLKYNVEKMRLAGWRVNNLRNFESSYELCESRIKRRLRLSIGKLISDCESLMDVGCRKEKLLKTFCPEGVKYFPVDYQAYDDETIACDFNKDFPDIKVDTCLCALTAEYVENLPQFLSNMCAAAQKQVLMLCRPINEKEMKRLHRWKNPFLTDFTEEFLIQTMEQNNFRLDDQYPTDNPSVILYDFRKIIE